MCIPLIRMVRFNLLAQFPENHISHAILSYYHYHCTHTHTHTHTHTYVYIYIYISTLNYIELNNLKPCYKTYWHSFMDVLLCERVSELRHSLFHLLNCLITTAPELRELPKVAGGMVSTIGTVRKGFDAHLGQIVCDKDGVVD